jgi:uncharacterized protein YjbI with pentapeptide repeats
MSKKLRRIPDRAEVAVPDGFDIPNREHQKILRGGVDLWNKWRKGNPDIIPHLGYTRLRRVDLSGYNFDKAYMPFAILSRCNFERASFINADLRGASLRRADLTKARLNGAILRHTSLAECVVNDAVFTRCNIYGISAWNLAGTPKDQSDMVLQANFDEPGITVDDLEVAQFIFLLLNNPKIRGVLDSVISKTVLILGRFTKKRKKVLDALRTTLRARDYVPIMFDFEKPTQRDFTETVSTLAHMARFVIADITDAKSIPQELQKIIPNLPSLPVRPIILEDQYEYAMFKDFSGYLSVLTPYRYEDTNQLLESLEEHVINPALSKAEEISQRRRAFEKELTKGLKKIRKFKKRPKNKNLR